MAVSEKNLINFGKKLSQIRKAKKLSFRQLAMRCDVDYSDIKKIEKGEVNIRLLTLISLSKGLSVLPQDLLDFEVDD